MIADTVHGQFSNEADPERPRFLFRGAAARSDVLESELAARGLAVFSSDADADDWHRHIKPDQIIALAMRRLEALGKGILLLHDIHPATAAALPGLLQQLKDNGFHIVQVVPATFYEIAMAKKPEAITTLPPDETIIGNGMDRKTQPSWPQASADNAADDSTLPVPDPSAFEPDTLSSEDTADVQWPAEPDLNAATTSRHARSEKSGRHMATASGRAVGGNIPKKHIHVRGTAPRKQLPQNNSRQERRQLILAAKLRALSERVRRNVPVRRNPEALPRGLEEPRQQCDARSNPKITVSRLRRSTPVAVIGGRCHIL